MATLFIGENLRGISNQYSTKGKTSGNNEDLIAILLYYFNIHDGIVDNSNVSQMQYYCNKFYLATNRNTLVLCRRGIQFHDRTCRCHSTYQDFLKMAEFQERREKSNEALQRQYKVNTRNRQNIRAQVGVFEHVTQKGKYFRIYYILIYLYLKKTFLVCWRCWSFSGKKGRQFCCLFCFFF